MRIAYVEPVVGLNVYGRELLPHLARYVDVEVVTDTERNKLCNDVASSFPVLNYTQASNRTNGYYDQMIFQLRNNPLHAPVYDLMMELGGVAVMHEITLLGIIGSQTLSQGRRLSFLRHVWLNEGAATGVRAGMDLFVFRRGVKRWSHLLMNRRVVQQSQGIIVHNRDAAQVLKARYPHLAVRIVRRGVPPALSFDNVALRQELNLANRWPVIASFGVVSERKRIAQVLLAMAEFVKEFPSAVYVLVGPIFGFDLPDAVNRLGLGDHVLTTGKVDDETFRRYLAATDIGANLRYPLEGESSSTALRLMSYGKPLLVTNAGFLAELPYSCVIKVEPGPGEVDQIRYGLSALARDASMRQRMGKAAQDYVKRYHTWERAAQTYYRFLRELNQETR
jgi:glycosyltransferase involved in cell wall biosynthesis